MGRYSSRQRGSLINGSDRLGGAVTRFECAFLRAAGQMFACRWEVMGHQVRGVRFHSLQFSLLGLHDYEAELRLMCAEARA